MDHIRIRIFSKIGGWNRQIERANSKFDGQFTWLLIVSSLCKYGLYCPMSTRLPSPVLAPLQSHAAVLDSSGQLECEMERLLVEEFARGHADRAHSSLTKGGKKGARLRYKWWWRVKFSLRNVYLQRYRLTVIITTPLIFGGPTLSTKQFSHEISRCNIKSLSKYRIL